MAINYKKTIAVDIGSRYIKIAAAVSNDEEEGLWLEDFSILEIPNEAFISSYPEKPLVAGKEIEAIIKESISEMKFKGRDVIISIPDSLTVVNWISVPQQATEAEMREQVLTKLQPVLAQDLENYFIDYMQVNKNDRNNILTQAVFKDSMLEIGKLFQDVGLYPLAVDSTFFNIIHSLYPSMEEEDKAGQNIAVVYLGHENSTIAIFRDTELRTLRKVNIGGSKITKILMSQLSMSYDEVEKIKQEETFFIPDNPSEQNKIKNYAIIRPVFGELIKELYNSFDSYLAKWREFKIDEIILTGGTSNFGKIDVAIQQHLNISVKRADSFVKIGCDKGIVREETNILMPVLGALMRQ